METEINGQDSIGNRTKESIAQDSGISSEPASANEVSVIKVNFFPFQILIQKSCFSAILITEF